MVAVIQNRRDMRKRQFHLVPQSAHGLNSRLHQPSVPRPAIQDIPADAVFPADLIKDLGDLLARHSFAGVRSYGLTLSAAPERFRFLGLDNALSLPTGLVSLVGIPVFLSDLFLLLP